MTSTTTENSQSPLADLIAKQTPDDVDGHQVVTMTDPRCPVCGADLVLRRVEVREVIHAITKAEVYDGGLGLVADVTTKDEAQSDECQNVQSDEIVCGQANTGCSFTISGHDVNIDWA